MLGITIPTSILGLDQARHPVAGGSTPPHNPAPGPSPAPAPALAPSPAPAPAAGTPGSSRQVEVRNPLVNPKVAAAMEGRTFHISGLIDRENRPPKHDDGRNICCAYHMRGRCSSGCQRSYSHVLLSESEASRLCTFVQERVVARNIGANS